MDRELKDFRGVACVYRAGEPVFSCAQGFADLANERANRLDTRFPVASGSKGFVGMGILRLIEEGKLSLDTRLGDAVDFDLRAIDPDVTVEQLLTHTSGVPDYFDESVMEDYDELWIDFPCYKIRKSADLLPLFIDKPMMYPRGERFQYNNTGFVLLGLIIEKATGQMFDEYLQTALFDPCGMRGTGYFETDRLPGNCANAYMWDKARQELCTNIFAVDTKGTGAGGAFTTAADMDAFWRGLYGGRVISREMMEKAASVHAEGEGGERYGYGVWVSEYDGKILPSLEGCDPGVCFKSEYFPDTQTSITVLSNYGDDVWRLHEMLRAEFVPAKQ